MRYFTAFVAFLAPLACLAGEPAGKDAAFDILEYQVEGNSVLPTLDIERSVYPHLGPGRTAKDVDAARGALEKAYNDAGYLTVVVEIPEQKVADGVVTLRVTEGKVDRYKVSGAQYTLPSKVREATPSMAAGTVPNFNEVQQDLAALGRNPDLRVNPLLRPGARPGTVEIELAMEEKAPLHGSLEANNKESADTKAGRLEAAIRYDNLWQLRHSFGINYFVAPTEPEQVEVWGMNYAMPLGAAILAGYFVRSNSNVPTVFNTQSIGKGDTAGLRWIRPLPQRGGFYHSLSLGFDYKNSEQTTLLLGAAATIDQPLRYWTAVTQYSGGYAAERGLWKFGADFVFGPRDANQREVSDSAGNKVDQFENRRPGARPNFALFRFDLEYRRTFGAGWAATGKLDLQRASGPLVNTEQFSAGGTDSVRGYLEGERQGDDGTRFSLNLLTPPLASLGEGLPLSALVFYDMARLRTRETTAGQQAHAGMASTGFGLRVGENRGATAEFLWAHALDDGAIGENRTRAGDERALVRVKYEF